MIFFYLIERFQTDSLPQTYSTVPPALFRPLMMCIKGQVARDYITECGSMMESMFFFLFLRVIIAIARGQLHTIHIVWAETLS